MNDEWKTVINKKRTKVLDKYNTPNTHYQNRFITKKSNDKFNKIHEISDDKKKTVMCSNILMYGKCKYNDKCDYAHTLSEQIVEPIRRLIYDILMDQNLKIDMKQIDDKVYNILLQFTNICNECSNNKCAGGMNCRYGVFDKRYQVCIDDLREGVCYTVTCNKLHLTTRGLLSMKEYKINNIVVNRKSKNIDDFDKQLNKNNDHTMLSIDSDDDFDDQIEIIKKYLNDDYDSDPDCLTSIFD